MIMYFAFKTYPGGGAFALFFHPHPREFATQNKKSANARGLARGGGWAQLELTDALLYCHLNSVADTFVRKITSHHDDVNVMMNREIISEDKS